MWWLCVCVGGCSLLPDIKRKPQFINPFPQIHTVAVLPFVNQSEESTLSSERVTLAYINELQAIPGFEVLPLGVVKNRLAEYQGPLACGADFQNLARFLGVDAVLLGSVIDFTPYYPPRISMKVNWYAANPGFHPVLPGYGLPWGTKDEKKIPRWVHDEAQRALATEQMRTQTPQLTAVSLPPPETSDASLSQHKQPPSKALTVPPDELPSAMPDASSEEQSLIQPTSLEIESADGLELPVGSSAAAMHDAAQTEALPAEWPDPRGFVPDPPASNRPSLLPQHEPIISHMRNYNGHDEDFTRRVSDYFYFRDDARFGGWQAYLQRSEDFIRVCCYFHVTETLACRGGEDESRLILRWPIDRYQR